MRNMEPAQLNQTLQETIHRFVSQHAKILNIKERSLSYGLSAVSLKRHELLLQENDMQKNVSLISKKASLVERRVLSHLHQQSANVPFSFSFDLTNDERTYICMQDVDWQTDYTNLNVELLQHKERKALSYIHVSNHGKQNELNWLPTINLHDIRTKLHGLWKPAWLEAIEDPEFVSAYREYIKEVESAAAYIEEDMKQILEDESTYTLIHHDLHPGNALVHNNEDVYFIDWEEARYGSLYFDLVLRFRSEESAEEYRELVNAQGMNIDKDRFSERHKIASRYMGLRYMSWFLKVWKENAQWTGELEKYLRMAVV